MKIRIKGNSLRYRLVKTDVTRLFNEGFLEEETQFLSKTFFYRLETTDEKTITADFIENSIIVKIPRELVVEWQETDRVTFSDKSGVVSILLEKDFVCLDHTDEDQSDNYPNPNLTC